MVSLGAFVLVALVTPFVAVVCFGVLIRYGSDPPRSVLALAAIAFATPGLAGIVALDPTSLWDAIVGIVFTVAAGIGFLTPRLVPTRDHYEYVGDWLLPRTDRERIDPEDEPATTWIAIRIIAAIVLFLGLYLTATALIPDEPAISTTHTIGSLQHPLQ